MAVGWAKPVFGLVWVGLVWVGLRSVGVYLSPLGRAVWSSVRLGWVGVVPIGGVAHCQPAPWLARVNQRMFTPLLVGCPAETISNYANLSVN